MSRLYGVLLVVVSAVAFGTLAVLAAISYESGTSPTTLLFLRFTAAGLVLTAFMGIRGIKFPRGRLLLGLALMGGVWYVAQTLAYFTALTMASTGLVALLLYLYPALVTLISAVVFQEQISRPVLLALGLALAGTVLTIGPGWEGESLGILLALAAALLYAGYIVAGGKLMQRVDPIPATTVIMLATGLSYGVLVALQGFQPPSAPQGWAAVAASAVWSVLALGAFFAGLERVGAPNAAILSTIEPFVTVGLAALLLNERIEPIRLMGGACILIAVVFLARIEMAKP
jgi:drug/metabolite transporter (DMT)-like permease